MDTALRRALADPAFYPHAPPTVEVLETHVSVVFLAGPLAYKLKKPVVLDFVDYGTLARRRSMCAEEVRLNRRLAPGVYLGVRAIVDDGGRLRLAAADAPGAVEYLVEMRRFDEARTLARLIERGAATAAHARAVARTLARFHAEAAPRAGRGGDPAEVKRTYDETFETLASLDDGSLAAELFAAQRFFDAFVAGSRGLLIERVERGRVRDCHGDLRTEHVLVGADDVVVQGEDAVADKDVFMHAGDAGADKDVLGVDESAVAAAEDVLGVDESAVAAAEDVLGVGGVEVVDCVEFDARLRETDVASDLAFLLMDLERLGARELADALLAAYRAAGGDAGDDRLLAFYAAQRAWVRAMVALLLHEAEPAAALVSLARRLRWRARAPLALVVCGGAATGKTTLARALSDQSGFPVVSSDVVRKRLAGLDPSERAPLELYADDASERTYAELARLAGAAGAGVIVDATCRYRRQRAVLFDALDAAVVVECVAPAAVVERRAHAREADRERVSDATATIARRQLAEFEPLDEVPPDAHLVLRADRDAGALVVDVEAFLDARA